jgi:hypothetical protein
MGRSRIMRKRRSNRNKYLVIGLLSLIVIVVAAIAALSMGGAIGKKPLASDYFIITHTESTGEFKGAHNETVVLATLGLNVTAIGGDATAVSVRCASQAYPMDDYIQTLHKGPPGWDLPITLAGGDSSTGYIYRGLPLDLNNNGMFEVEVTVSANEVQSSVFTVLINPKNILGVPVIPG